MAKTKDRSGRTGLRGLAEILKKGILTENPTFVQLLGMCPTLATTTSVKNGFGMGLAATAVLICSNTLISLLRKFIPKQVRIAAYIVVISGFVTAVEMLMKAYFYDLYGALGLFIPLIVVNCIILARAEAFASKNKVLPSAVDGLAYGLGFTGALTLIGSIRELLGAGTLLGHQVLGDWYSPAIIFILPAGAFFTLSFLIACVQKVRNGIDDKKRLERLSNISAATAIPANTDYSDISDAPAGDLADDEPALEIYPSEIDYPDKTEGGHTETNKADADITDYPDADRGMPL